MPAPPCRAPAPQPTARVAAPTPRPRPRAAPVTESHRVPAWLRGCVAGRLMTYAPVALVPVGQGRDDRAAAPRRSAATNPARGGDLQPSGSVAARSRPG